jgi:hypothetical protein
MGTGPAIPSSLAHPGGHARKVLAEERRIEKKGESLPALQSYRDKGEGLSTPHTLGVGWAVPTLLHFFLVQQILQLHPDAVAGL